MSTRTRQATTRRRLVAARAELEHLRASVVTLSEERDRAEQRAIEADRQTAIAQAGIASRDLELEQLREQLARLRELAAPKDSAPAPSQDGAA